MNIPLLCFNKLLGCFGCMFWAIVHLYYEMPPYQFLKLFGFEQTMSLNTSKFIQLLLSCVTSSTNTSVQCHWQPSTHKPSNCLLQTMWYDFESHPFFILFSCHHSGRGWSWFHLFKECISTTVLPFFFLDVFSKVQSRLSILWSHCTLHRTLCIYFHAVFSLW